MENLVKPQSIRKWEIGSYQEDINGGTQYNFQRENGNIFIALDPEQQLKRENKYIPLENHQTQLDELNPKEPEEPLKLPGVHHSYKYLKKFALEHLQKTTMKQLRLLRDIYQCENNSQELSPGLDHSIFSWSLEDFLKRRQLKDLVWIDVMQKTAEPCLNIYKYKQDIKQLEEYLQLIFKGLLSYTSRDDEEIYKHITNPIDDALKVLEITQHVEQELLENNYLLKELILKDSVFANIQRDSVDQMTKICLQSRILNSHIWNPIETRYQLSWHQNQVKQLQYRLESSQEARVGDIEKYRQLSERENWVNGSSMDFYYSEMEAIKNRIQQMQEKFDNDREIIENRIVYKRAQIEKLHDQRKFLKEEIKRFHKEIERMRLRQEEEERKRIQLEEEKLLALQKKGEKMKKKKLIKLKKDEGVKNRLELMKKTRKN